VSGPGPFLTVDKVEMRFGGLVALQSVSFTAQKGHITAVIGPNGAGKTTLFNCMTGMYVPTSGSITFKGADIAAKRPDQIARVGIARTFQNLALFRGMSVRDNLLVGAYRHGRSGLLEGALTLMRARREQRQAEARAAELLEFLELDDVADALPDELPYGRQKQVEFGRALMQDAELILLDEPMAGMSRQEKSAMVGLIRRVREEHGVSFLLVEHDMPVIMDLSDHIVVLDFGRKIADGKPHQVQNDKAVIAAYLGDEVA